ncbi:MAG: pilus assembly protein [Acidimicrobiia bacterium]|nr:pilus assembly protein [Acidimicrobiia bacterium]
MSKLRNRGKDERGAALVEFAIMAILLFSLLFGMVEYGWVFANNLDARHGAREAARLAAVNWGGSQAIADETCDRMDIQGGAIFTFTGGGSPVGSVGTVAIDIPYTPLVGLPFIPTPTNLRSQVEIRLEQASTWTNITTTACP